MFAQQPTPAKDLWTPHALTAAQRLLRQSIIHIDSRIRVQQQYLFLLQSFEDKQTRTAAIVAAANRGVVGAHGRGGAQLATSGHLLSMLHTAVCWLQVSCLC